VLILPIHDVTPALGGLVRAAWDLCCARGLRPALFVVPEWHGAWPLESHADFVDWLRQRQSEGAEILLHGERHDEAGQRRGRRDQLRAFGRTDHEGEFLMLGYDQARARMTRGLARLRALGLEPIGFVPPAWLGADAVFAAARDVGLQVAEDVRSIHLLQSERRLLSPVIRWSARTQARARLSTLIALARWRLQRRAPLVRLALHPPDLGQPWVAASLARTLDRWRLHHDVAGYADLCCGAQLGQRNAPRTGHGRPRESLASWP
jgi:predicted deacetylase